MSTLLSFSYFAAVLLAASLEIFANFLLAQSKGFTKRKQALGALFFVGAAFSCLAYAVQAIDLTVAYALWGGFGILGTSIGAWILLGQKLRLSAWAGIILLIGGMSLLQLY